MKGIATWVYHQNPKPLGPKPVVDLWKSTPMDEQSISLSAKKNWLVVSTHLKNISQIGSFPQIGMKIRNL